MERLCVTVRRGVQSLGFLFLAFWLAGCATGPKIDWNSRIGNYTYDQAVLELGPPDKVASLTEGSRVADWLTMRGFSSGYVMAGGPAFYRPYMWAGPNFYYADSPSPDRFLRLTFGPDGRLVAWRKVYR